MHAIDGPDEAALVETARGAPHTEAVMLQQLHACAARVGEEIAMVRQGGTEDFHHAGDQAVGIRAHVGRLGSQPHRINADHRSSASRPRIRRQNRPAKSP